MQVSNNSKEIRFRLLLITFLCIFIIGRIGSIRVGFFRNSGMLMLNQAFSSSFQQKQNILRESIILFKYAYMEETGGLFQTLLGRSNIHHSNEFRYSIAQDFYHRGEVTEKLGNIKQSRNWLQYTSQLSVTSELDLYYQGLSYLRLLKWTDAQNVFEQAVKVTDYPTASSSLYYLGWLYQWHNEPRRLEEALSSYQLALNLDKFESNYEKSETYYHKGEILRWSGRNTEEIISDLENAIELAPNHVAAHTLLGMVYYEQFKDVTLAEHEIYIAIKLNPKYKWAYIYLGDIYSTEGQYENAIQMYQDALKIDPNDCFTLEKLKALLLHHARFWELEFI